MNATLEIQINGNRGNNMKIVVGVIILSIFVFLIASPVGSSYFEDANVVTDAYESSPSNPDPSDQETSKGFPILVAMSFLGLVAVRRPTSDK